MLNPRIRGSACIYVCVWRMYMHLNHVLMCCTHSRMVVRWSRIEMWLGLIAIICQYVFLLLLLLLLLFAFAIIIWLLLFIGAFAKLRTANTSFVMFIFPFVRPPVRPLGTTRLPLDEFLWFWWFWIFRKAAEKIQGWLKCGKSNGYFTWSPLYFYDNMSLDSSLNEMLRAKILEKIEKHVLCPITFFPPKNRAF
jgi:hypothetical protein